MSELQVIIGRKDHRHAVTLHFAGRSNWQLPSPLQPQPDESPDQYRKWLFSVVTEDTRSNRAARATLQWFLSEMHPEHPTIVIYHDLHPEYEEHLRVLGNCFKYLHSNGIVLVTPDKLDPAE